MTLIVASLFLPYKPQFKLEAIDIPSDNAAESRRMSIHAEAESPTRPAPSPKRRSFITPVPPAFIDKNLSQDSLVLKSEPFRRLKHMNSTDRLVTSQQFMDNLTAGATSLTQQNRRGPSLRVINNATGNRMYSPYLTPTTSSNSITQLDYDSTENLLRNVDQSLSKQSFVKTTVKGKNDDSYFTYKPATSTFVNSKLKYSQNFEPTVDLPGTRKPLFAKSETIASPTVSLTHVSVSPYPIQLDSAVDLSFSLTGAEEHYHVPEFGGYSNINTKLRQQLLHRSQELFSMLPWEVLPNDAEGNGPLKQALNGDSIHEKVFWIGTMGIPTDEIPEELTKEIESHLELEFDSYAVVTDDTTFIGCYKNFCKQILWPTLHYQIPDNPRSKAFEDHSWNYYKALNQLFANKVISVYKEGDTIWIHDYHLLLLPGLVRKALPHARIGFFLHLSFPSSEVFRCLAHREEILEGILGANFIGFQTREYARHFMQTCARLLMADITDNDESYELQYKGHITRIDYVPSGIDAFNIQSLLFQSDEIREHKKLLRERFGEHMKLIVSRDHCDRISGLMTKLLSYELFLKDNPDYIGMVSLIQVCPGKILDDDLNRQLILIIDRINSLTNNIGISPPVVFLHQTLDHEEFIALSSEADLFWVNSQREGMNLTCHEFIASSWEKNAPLLLSEFTGSASLLSDGAILINPWDIKGVSKELKRAIELPPKRRSYYWKKMMKKIMANDSHFWLDKNLKMIEMSWKSIKERTTVFKVDYDKLVSDYQHSKKRVFLFKISEPPTARMIYILNELSSVRNNIVYVMNSYSKTVQEILYSRVPNVGLIAENGAYIRINGLWYNMVDQIDWKNEVIKILDDKVERLPGSYYKLSDSMIKFHTENAVDRDRVKNSVGEAISHINTLFFGKGIHAFLHEGVVYVQQEGVSLDAIKFLFNYYNSVDVDHPKQAIDSMSRTPKTDERSHEQPGASQIAIDFACITGSSSPIIDPIFKFITDELKNKSLHYGHTITYRGNTSSFAHEHVNGLNELFVTMYRLAKAAA